MTKVLAAALLSLSLYGGELRAVVLSTGGQGQVLIYPYYTVRNEQASLISVVNFSDQVSTISIQVVEGKGGVASLDLHVYLPPFDVWTAALIDDGEGARLYSTDMTCTNPPIPEQGMPISANRFLGDGFEDDSRDRTREGLIQMIEMGRISGPLGNHSFHPNPNCGRLIAAWEEGGEWDNDPLFDMSTATGDLTGSVMLIDIPAGRAVSLDAVALAQFRTEPLHVPPGSFGISLADVEPPVSTVVAQGQIIESTWSEHPIQAVSAVLQGVKWEGEYVLDEVTQSHTDWILSMPTRRFHRSMPEYLPPFTFFDFNQGQCDLLSPLPFDRNSQRPVGSGDPLGLPWWTFHRQICWATNVIAFGRQPTSVLGSGLFVAESELGFENGWFRYQTIDENPAMVSDEGHQHFGLPIIGNALITYDNGVLDGHLRSYAVTSSLSGTRQIEVPED